MKVITQFWMILLALFLLTQTSHGQTPVDLKKVNLYPQDILERIANQSNPENFCACQEEMKSNSTESTLEESSGAPIFKAPLENFEDIKKRQKKLFNYMVQQWIDLKLFQECGTRLPVKNQGIKKAKAWWKQVLSSSLIMTGKKIYRERDLSFMVGIIMGGSSLEIGKHLRILRDELTAKLTFVHDNIQEMNEQDLQNYEDLIMDIISGILVDHQSPHTRERYGALSAFELIIPSDLLKTCDPSDVRKALVSRSHFPLFQIESSGLFQLP